MSALDLQRVEQTQDVTAQIGKSERPRGHGRRAVATRVVTHQPEVRL